MIAYLLCMIDQLSVCNGYSASWVASDSNTVDNDCTYLCLFVCVWHRDVVREVVRLFLALNARSHAVSLARQTNVSLADWFRSLIPFCTWHLASDGQSTRGANLISDVHSACDVWTMSACQFNCPSNWLFVSELGHRVICDRVSLVSDVWSTHSHKLAVQY